MDIVVRAAGADQHNLYDVAGDGFVLIGDCWRGRPKTDAEAKTETAAALLYRSGAQIIFGATWPSYSTAMRVTWNLPKPYWRPAGGAADTKEGGGGPTVSDGDRDVADSGSGQEDTTGNDGRTRGTDNRGSNDEETNPAGTSGTTGPDEGDHDDAEDGDGEGDVDCDNEDDEDVGGDNNSNIGVSLVNSEY